MEASITKEGAVLLGEEVSVDAHSHRPYRVITHAHLDHILGFSESLRKCKKVIATPQTKEILKVLKENISEVEGIEELSYEETIQLDGCSLTLYPANHIIGACQVLIIERSGKRLLYTGDFRLEGTPVVEADLLVIEATYGNPSNRRPFKGRVKEELLCLVEIELEKNPVYIFGYHGKLQEVANLLTEGGIDVPMILPSSVYKVAGVCRKYGMKLGSIFLANSPEGKRRIREGNYIRLQHSSSSHRVKERVTKIYLTGWEFKAPCKKIAPGEYVVSFSDHGDFDELLEYVRMAQPSLVITDNFRVGDAKVLAREIKKHLGIDAIPMP
jgi:putative mRNA 3-end processing factor